MQIVDITARFETGSEPVSARPITKGAVNDSFLVDMADGSGTVLQRINRNVFQQPEVQMANIAMMSQFLDTTGQAFPHLHFYRAFDGKYLFADPEGNYWRAYRHVPGIIQEENTVDGCAKLGFVIGAFHRALADFPVEKLNPAIPHFHNTPKYFEEFVRVLSAAPADRAEAARGEINYVRSQEQYCTALLSMDLYARVTHNDVRLSNLVLDIDTGNPVCLIDYDTIMPGMFAFDFGDGARSACHTCRDDEANTAQVQFNLQMFESYANSYVSQAKTVLEDNEPGSLAMGAYVMALEYGIRYMTDFLMGDRYFKAEYPAQNLNRARVQLLLSMQIQKAYPQLCQIVKAAFQK